LVPNFHAFSKLSDKYRSRGEGEKIKSLVSLHSKEYFEIKPVIRGLSGDSSPLFAETFA
jgi:hypothetical protein